MYLLQCTRVTFCNAFTFFAWGLAARVTMMLERNNHVELRPTIQQLFDMTQKVARDLITVVQMVPRLALQATPRQLKELEVSCVSHAVAHLHLVASSLDFLQVRLHHHASISLTMGCCHDHS